MGFPVFQSTPEKGIGLAYMLGSTGGYLAGFVVMAAIVGWAADRGWDRNPVKLFAAMLVGQRHYAGHGLCLAGGADRRGKGMDLGVVPFIVPRPDQGRAGSEPGPGRLVAAAEARLRQA